MRPRIAIVDFVSGRGLGGHHVDYLSALQEALDGYDQLLIAPFINGTSFPTNRFAVYRLETSGLRRAMREADVVIVHSPEFSEHICLWLAALTIRRRRRGKCLFVLRRGPDSQSSSIKSDRLTRLLVGLTTGMIRRRVIIPVSDSRPALDAWLALVPGFRGETVAMPPLPATDDEEPSYPPVPLHEGPLLAIPGRMRGEKGARNYPAVVAAALATLPDCAIAIQVSEDDEVSRIALAGLRERFGGNERVHLLDEHLSAGGYRALLGAADIVVLPYDVASYGGGTSGVVSDALAAGAVVVVSPIEWAVATYAADPHVIFIDDPASNNQLADAIARAATLAVNAGEAPALRETFAKSWRAAIDSAL